MESTSQSSKSKFPSSNHGFDEEMQIGEKGTKNSDDCSDFNGSDIFETTGTKLYDQILKYWFLQEFMDAKMVILVLLIMAY